MMKRVAVIDQQGSFRLIECSPHGYAVVEARGGHVYSMDREMRRESEDSEAGMADVVGDDGWCDRQTASARFEQLVKAGQRYAEKIW